MLNKPTVLDNLDPNHSSNDSLLRETSMSHVVTVLTQVKGTALRG